MDRIFKMAVSISHNAVIITDTNANIIYTNEAFTDFTGYTAKEVKNKNPRILQSGEHSKEFYEDMWNTLISGKTWSGELHNKTKDGNSFWEFAIIAPVKNNGRIYYVSVKENITKVKQLETKLIYLYDKIERLNGHQKKETGIASL